MAAQAKKVSPGPLEPTAGADSIRLRIGDAENDALERIVAEQPVYRRMSPAQLDDVRALLHSNFRVLTAAISGSRVSHQQLAYVGEHVRTRVRAGIPLDAVLDAYRIGLNVFWERCTAEVAARGMGREEAVGLARRVSEAMDTLTTHAAAAYVREESHLAARREQAARDVLESLLRGDYEPPRSEQQRLAPGLDPEGDLTVIVARVGGPTELGPGPEAVATGGSAGHLDAAQGALRASLSVHGVAPLSLVRERSVVVVAPAEPLDRVLPRLVAVSDGFADQLRVDLFIGVSSTCSGFSSVPAGYGQASLAVSRASADSPVISLERLPAIQHLLSGATLTTRRHLLNNAGSIRALRANDRRTMRATLAGFAAADMSVTRGAAALHVHENTLRYRLRAIHQRTGHDPRSFAGLLELLCLIDALDAEEPRSQTSDDPQRR